MPKTITLKRGENRDFSGVLAEPGGDGKAGAVLLFHEWWGLSAHVTSLAERLAEAGFLALAIDMYDGKVTTDGEEAGRLMSALDTFDVMDRAKVGLRALVEHPRSNGKVGATGFCLGGAMAFAAACHVPGLSAVVPFYGVPAPEKVDYTKVTAPILAHFAKNDAWAKAEKAEAIAAIVNGKGGSMTVHVYDAGHAFVNDTRPEVYDAKNAALAWSRTVSFFREHLG